MGFDSISLHYFEMDGCSFWGNRNLITTPDYSWISVNNCALTIESASTDLEISETIDVEVVADIITVTDLDNEMVEWLQTAPEGMGE